MSSPSGVNGSGGNGPPTATQLDQRVGVLEHLERLAVPGHSDDAVVRLLHDRPWSAEVFEVRLRVGHERRIGEEVDCVEVGLVTVDTSECGHCTTGLSQVGRRRRERSGRSATIRSLTRFEFTVGRARRRRRSETPNARVRRETTDPIRGQDRLSNPTSIARAHLTAEQVDERLLGLGELRGELPMELPARRDDEARGRGVVAVTVEPSSVDRE